MRNTSTSSVGQQEIGQVEKDGKIYNVFISLEPTTDSGKVFLVRING